MKTLLLAALLVSQGALARNLTFEQKSSDLNDLVAQVKAGYGPLQYKKEKLGIDVDSLKEKYLQLIKESKSNSEFYYLIVKFVAEFQDSHFRANLPTSLTSSLGFTTDLVQGAVVIDEIDLKVLPADKFPFAKGDEIISLGGKPIAEELAELIPYMGQGFELAAKRKAAFMISERIASKVPVQSGKTVVEVRRGNSIITEKVELEWKQKGEFTDEANLVLAKLKQVSRNAETIKYDTIELAEQKFRCSPESRIKVPEGATDIMKAACKDKECKVPFAAYYYPTAKGNVGYLRIPHYSPTEANPTIDAKKLRLAQYTYAVKQMEKNTVGLVIDQDHNCGGSVEWLHQFLELFINKPFPAMQFELLATKASYTDFKGWLAAENEHTLGYSNSQDVLNLIKETWLKTDKILTTKTAIDGNGLRYPNAVNYTKPIIVLIDELSGSGGDAFPAMMKGLGRAKLIGTRTMGAGGHVVNLPPLNYSQISVAITKSLFYRPDDVAVENNGAEPDLPYSPSLNDFKYGYKEYQKYFTDELLKML